MAHRALYNLAPDLSLESHFPLTLPPYSPTTVALQILEHGKLSPAFEHGIPFLQQIPQLFAELSSSFMIHL